MKILLLLIASLALATQHNFKEVNYNGETLNNVVLITDDKECLYQIWHDRKLVDEKFVIVSCNKPEKFCLMEAQQSPFWIQRRTLK